MKEVVTYMSVKERILSIRLINRNKTHTDFVKEIGVTTAMVVNNENNLIKDKKEGEHNYGMEITN